MHLLTLRTVLVATDLDSGSQAAIETGRRLAIAAGAALHVVHVGGDASSSASRDAVDAFVRSSGVSPDARHVHLLDGDPSHAIRLLADRIAADVIVLGPHRERPGRVSGPPLGSTALAVVTDSFAPCLVARSPLHVPLARVLVAVDLSDTARGALVAGLSWASALRASPASTPRGATTTMMVLHVERANRLPTSPLNPPAPAVALETELRRIRADAGQWASVSIEDFTLSGDDTARTIADAASRHEADLVVLGTRGLGLDRTGRLGSVSAAVVRRAAVPVLLVPPAVWLAHGLAETSPAAG